MTREERLKLLKQIEKDIHVCSLESTLLDDAKSCAIHSAIEELNQEPILDRIRAELIQAIQNGTIKIERGNEELFRIIDKHRVESEKV